MFTRKFLKQWWRRALRRKILFSALNQEDRGYLYLAMKAFDEIRNADVGTIIVKILAKLKDALKSPFVRRMEEFGYRKARKIAGQAVEWGSNVAMGWASDLGFVKYLTLMDLNQSTGWGV